MVIKPTPLDLTLFPVVSFLLEPMVSRAVIIFSMLNVFFGASALGLALPLDDDPSPLLPPLGRFRLLPLPPLLLAPFPPCPPLPLPFWPRMFSTWRGAWPLPDDATIVAYFWTRSGSMPAFSRVVSSMSFATSNFIWLTLPSKESRMAMRMMSSSVMPELKNSRMEVRAWFCHCEMSPR